MTRRLRSSPPTFRTSVDARFRDRIEVLISGSALLYDLDVPAGFQRRAGAGARGRFPRHPPPDPRADHLPTPSCASACPTWSRSPASMPACRATRCRPAATADRVAVRFLQALRVAGGTPGPASRRGVLAGRAAGQAVRHLHLREPRAHLRRHRVPRPERPGRLPRLFANPLPARGRAGLRQFADVSHPQQRAAAPRAGYAYPWRDNFCERRGFPVSQCPAGVGHQGQDIRPARASRRPAPDRCVDDDVVAVRDGVILRSPARRRFTCSSTRRPSTSASATCT